MAHSLEVGSRIGSKDELRGTVGVSMGTLNEALRLLVNRGVITVRPGPGGGVFVNAPAPFVRLGNLMFALSSSNNSGIQDVVRVRDALEPQVIMDAALHRTSDDIRELRKLTKVASEQSRREDNRLDPQFFWALHRRIAMISPNTLLRGLYLGLIDFIEMRTGPMQPKQGDVDYVATRIDLHRQIVDAIEARDITAAKELADRHALDAPIPAPGRG